MEPIPHYIVYGFDSCQRTKQFLKTHSDFNIDYKIMTVDILEMLKQGLGIQSIQTPQIFQIMEGGEHVYATGQFFEVMGGDE